MKKLVFLFLLFGFTLGVTASFSSKAAVGRRVVVIVHTDTGLTNVSQEDIKKMFLGKSNRINGISLVTVKPEDGKTYSLFREKILGLNKEDEKNYWLKEIMKGEVKLVKQVKNDSAVATIVASDSRSIGMVSLSAYNNARSKGLKIKALKINGISHGNKNYPLQ